MLRGKSEPIERVDDELRALADDMLETMYDAPGNRTRPQFRSASRAACWSSTAAVRRRENNPIVFINPEIVDSSDDRSTYEEGCLSIPDYYAEVERPAEVTVSYIDRDGAPQEIRASGLLATCVQHEIDHLNGVLFIDHISKLKRDMVVRKFTKLAKSRGTTAL